MEKSLLYGKNGRYGNDEIVSARQFSMINDMAAAVWL
jgi:hypothetical protein